jgi:hypothetical protein
VIFVNKATFIQPGGGNKSRSLTKTHCQPNITSQYIRDMLVSQKVKESRTVTEAEEELMMNRIWNADYRNRR